MAFMQNLISKIITFAKYIYRSICALIFSLIEHNASRFFWIYNLNSDNRPWWEFLILGNCQPRRNFDVLIVFQLAIRLDQMAF